MENHHGPQNDNNTALGWLSSALNGAEADGEVNIKLPLVEVDLGVEFDTAEEELNVRVKRRGTELSFSDAAQPEIDPGLVGEADNYRRREKEDREVAQQDRQREKMLVNAGPGQQPAHQPQRRGRGGRDMKHR